MIDGKIGIGIVTCDRPEFYSKCITSILETHKQIDIEKIVVVKKVSSSKKVLKQKEVPKKAANSAKTSKSKDTKTAAKKNADLKK